jgi:hypothetical protein
VNDLSVCATDIIGYNDINAMDDFDSKAYSLMRSHFISTRETKKKKEMKDDGRQLRSKTVADDIHNEFDYESSSVTTSNTRRLSRYLLEDFLPLPEHTPLLLLIPYCSNGLHFVP